MVKINNQRKAFLDMLAWSEAIWAVETRKYGYDVIVGGETIYWLLRSPSQTCHAKLSSNQQAPDATSFFPLVGCLPQAAWPERLLSKSQDAVALQQIKERGALPMIDRGDIRRAVDRCSISGLHCRALRLPVKFEHKADSLIANSKKRAERSERLMYEQSHRDYLRSELSASSSIWRKRIIIAVITPFLASARQNARELKLANAAIPLTCRCVSVMLLRSMQNTRRS